MPSPSWFLLAWGVVAVGSIWKFWRFTQGWRQRTGVMTRDTEAFRASLERRWSPGQRR
ncbi:hypothetical protein [Synechococcus sp. A15-28]|uniref:hypothetical protein n=1 Tax=Synechococcus sp. A15-28 TaxID=1050638 RepID=UPI00164559D3|nr:hypothetical protein [Synechococcus sp. A15-28]QNI42564.1 hypothetical protein SynA1528_01534 [Synechococcus sp. A15-28]